MTDAPRLPTTLRIASAMLLVQGAGLLVAGGFELIDALVGTPNDRFTATFLGAVTIVYAVIVLLVGLGLRGARRAAATPALMVEFFAIVIGVGQLRTLLAVAIALLVTAAVAFATLLHPDSRAVVFGDR